MKPRFVELHEAIWQVMKARSAEGLCAEQERLSCARCAAGTRAVARRRSSALLLVFASGTR